jgi:hypothetical protein
MGIINKLFETSETSRYIDSGEMPSNKPFQILESEEYVRVSEDYFTGEACDTQDFGTMTGEEAADFLREFDIGEDSNYPGAGEAGFSHETYEEDSNWGPDFDSWDMYRINLNLNEDEPSKIKIKASDPIIFFPRYTSLEFEF